MTIWWCERCHASGFVDLTGMDVYSGVYQLEAVHDAHTLALLLDCRFSTANVRVEEFQAQMTARAIEED